MTDATDESDAPPALGATDFDPVGFLETAVSTPSHEDVGAMRRLLVETLEAFGADVAVDEGGCVVARKGSPAPEEGPHVVANTHIDTVTPHVAFERDREATGPEAGAGNGSNGAGPAPADVIRGRGACDAKGPLAALLYGYLATEPARGRLTLAVTPDEETLSRGAAALTGKLPGSGDGLDGDLYLVGEPTGLDVCTAAKGRFQGRVELDGEAAHAAEFAGANAVAAAEGALAAIRRFDDDADDHPQLGPPKLTPTVVEGGGATNQVPADCAITVDRRSVPPETAEGFRSALEGAVRAAVDATAGGAAAVDARVTLADRDAPFFEAFSTDPDHAFVETVAAAARGATADAGLPADRGGAVRPFGAATEASYFAPAPTVVFGPGDLADDAGAVAHAEREYVRVREVAAAAETVAAALDRTLG
ncbi:M20/M25/M40 family metallo-hydrolase [Halorubrum halodurans]|uniref:Succinyl-diaminopimelate desuccinylase n=1 Tax=Halorubrum halodurans TaxID=1383851 RepID=A0A256IDX0_9EURY|nr:M20/M25/M40 family metallo-hydrolase [Halorubrum halodurans]OYR54372.1 succinyl-diaminopimelate desuccinylase [Halorubrum halodurans]